MATRLICLGLHLGPRAPCSCQLPPHLHTWSHPRSLQKNLTSLNGRCVYLLQDGEEAERMPWRSSGPLLVCHEFAGWTWHGAFLSKPPVQRHLSFSIAHVTPRKSKQEAAWRPTGPLCVFPPFSVPTSVAT